MIIKDEIAPQTLWYTTILLFNSWHFTR